MKGRPTDKHANRRVHWEVGYLIERQIWYAIRENCKERLGDKDIWKHIQVITDKQTNMDRRIEIKKCC